MTTPDPSPSASLPVLVFLHGGGFTVGTGQAALYDGTSFAQDGVVLVALNYRLGIAGWLDVPGAPANRGLLDVLAALHWVADNISAFGGDPGRVTLAGQSAGAMMVCALLAAPAARGLFRRAISQSGSGECAYQPGQAKLVTDAVSAALGIPATAHAMSELEDKRLTDVLSELPPIDHAAHGFRDTSLANSPFKPVLDGVLLDRQPAQAVVAGQAVGAELLIGTNRDEANLYTVPSGAIGGMDERQLLAVAARRYEDAEGLVAALRPEQGVHQVPGCPVSGSPGRRHRRLGNSSMPSTRSSSSR